MRWSGEKGSLHGRGLTLKQLPLLLYNGSRLGGVLLRPLARQQLLEPVIDECHVGRRELVIAHEARAGVVQVHAQLDVPDDVVVEKHGALDEDAGEGLLELAAGWG